MDEFWQAGIDAGYEDDGEPGERPPYTPGYYGAFLCDPDGNSTEAVHHADVRRGGNIDHLWIRVRDLDGAMQFYTTIAPHTGLREGRRWELGRQFRGAWATFSFVQEERAPTEHFNCFPGSRPPYRRGLPSGDHGSRLSRQRRPSEQSRDQSDYYAASVLDPDGTIVESVFHERT